MNTPEQGVKVTGTASAASVPGSMAARRLSAAASAPQSAGTPGTPGGRRALPVEYERYLHGPGVHVPDRIAAVLMQRLQLTNLATQIRGVDADADAVLFSLIYAGTRYLTARSAKGTPTVTAREQVSSSDWLTTRAVATQLGMTVRGVRMAISAGRLEGERVDSRWRVRRGEVEQYRSKRTA